MNFEVKFTDGRFKVDFGEVNRISDGGYDKGYSDGYAAGEVDGETKGEEIGYSKGYTKGEADGYSKGHTAGETEGYNKGHTDGEQTGYADALAKRTELEVTENGEYTPDGESTGFSKVNVNIPSGAEIEDGLIDDTITSYRNDRITNVKQRGLSYFSNMISIDLPNVKRIGSYGIAQNKNLATISLPSFEKPIAGSNYLLDNNTSLLTISLPSAIDVGGYCFNNCRKLATIELPVIQTVQNGAFANCYSLTTLILRGTYICTFSGANVFSGCYHILGTVNATYNPEGLKDGYIYVPKNLIEQYKVATNWATYADQFRAIEDYPEITGG